MPKELLKCSDLKDKNSETKATNRKRAQGPNAGTSLRG